MDTENDTENKEDENEDEEEGGDHVTPEEDGDDEEDRTDAQKSLPREGETPMSENQQNHGKKSL